MRTKMIKSCNYFIEETFNKYLLKHNVSQNSFSIMHLNIRSMPANFTSFLSYLENITHKFSVIGLTETWLKQSNVPLYGITGYNHIAITRSHGKGGGVSLLISDVFVYSELTDMCILDRELGPSGVSRNQRSRWKHAFSPLKHVWLAPL